MQYEIIAQPIAKKLLKYYNDIAFITYFELSWPE